MVLSGLMRLVSVRGFRIEDLKGNYVYPRMPPGDFM